jgi:hypothetical protein
MSYIGNEPFTAAFLTDTFSGNGSTVAFTMTVAPASTSAVIVAITGVLQDPSTYSVSGTTLTFSAAPPTGTSNISVRYLGIPASGVTTTAYRTVTNTTATAGQTSFTIPSYTVGYIDVYRNGVYLPTADYTATTGTTVVLNNAATVGDTITTVSFFVSSVLNALPTTGGTLSGQLTVNSATGQKPLIAQVNGTEVFEVDASGNLLVGLTSPTFSASTRKSIEVNGSTDSFITFGAASSAIGYLYASASEARLYSFANVPLLFGTNNIERARIDTSGNLLVGATASANSTYSIATFRGASKGIAIQDSGSAAYRAIYMGGGNNLYFYNGTNEGYLSSAGAWTNASDARLKTNVRNIEYGLATVLETQPRHYERVDVEGTYIGFVAQELQEVIPEVVSGDPEKQLGVDYGSLVAVAFKAIQEMKAIIDTQASTITKLQADVAALKGNQ